MPLSHVSIAILVMNVESWFGSEHIDTRWESNHVGGNIIKDVLMDHKQTLAIN